MIPLILEFKNYKTLNEININYNYICSFKYKFLKF